MKISGLNKADVLAALYNAAKPQGMGFVHYDPKPMTREEAEDLLQQATYFDYLNGRAMKIALDGDEVYTGSYNNNNGDGAAERVIAELVKTGNVNSSVIQAVHHENTLESAEETKANLNEESGYEGGGVFRLGLADVADKLGPIVDEVVKKKSRS